MPTRFTLNGSGKPIFEEFRQAYLGDEIYPTAFVPAICEHGELKLLRWGLTPSWAKEDFGGSMCHARREKLFVQNTFKTSIWRRRCLIPATAFFEWQEKLDGSKAKFKFTIPKQPLFYMAGLWDDWIDPNGSEIASCAIITTYPNSLILRYKPQMPAILKPADIELFMDHTLDQIKVLDHILHGLDSEEFRVERQ